MQLESLCLPAGVQALACRFDTSSIESRLGEGSISVRSVSWFSSFTNPLISKSINPLVPLPIITVICFFFILYSLITLSLLGAGFTFQQTLLPVKAGHIVLGNNNRRVLEIFRQFSPAFNYKASKSPYIHFLVTDSFITLKSLNSYEHPPSQFGLVSDFAIIHKSYLFLILFLYILILFWDASIGLSELVK